VHAAVRRDGAVTRIPVEDVVPGDVVELAAGDLVPADGIVLASRAAICVAQFMGAPDHKTKLKELQGAESYQRSELIEKGGWDRMPGQEKAAWGVSGACLAGLESAIKTGA